MWAPAASPAWRALPSLPGQPSPAVVQVGVALPVAARARGLAPPRRLCLAVPRASEIAAEAEDGEEEERRWWRGAAEMDAEVRREMAIRRLQEEAETGRSRREFAVFETARGDTLFTQSWTPAADDGVSVGPTYCAQGWPPCCAVPLRLLVAEPFHCSGKEYLAEYTFSFGN